MREIKYKLLGKDRKQMNTVKPVHFAELTFNELKKVKQRPNQYSNITVEIPCPKNREVFHQIPLTEAKKHRFERELAESAHEELTPEWANPNHQPVSAPKEYDFCFRTDQNEEVFINKSQRDGSLFLIIPAREIQEVKVDKIGFKCRYLNYELDDRIVTITSPPDLQEWLRANTKPETPVIDSKQEEMIRHGGGRRLCLIERPYTRIVNAFPQYYDPNHATPTHRYVSHVPTEFLTDYLDNKTPAIQKIMKEAFERGIGTLWGGSHLIRISQEEMDQIVKEHHRIGQFVV